MHRLGLCGTECIQGSRVGLGRNESRAQQSFETPNDAAKQSDNNARADQLIDKLVAGNPESFQAYLARWRYRRG